MVEERNNKNLVKNISDPEPNTTLLTSKQAMEHLHITSAGTLINYKKKGLPFLQVGRQCLFDKQELNNYLKQKTKII